MEIFVNNLAYQVEDKEIRDLFAAFGEVRRAAVVKDRETGQSRGFAFVDMPNAAEAQRAIGELNGQPLQGRNMAVSEARPRESRPAPGGGYGGGPSQGGFGGPRPPRPAYTPSSSQGGYSSAPSQPYGAPMARRPVPPVANLAGPEELEELAARKVRAKNFGPDKRKAKPDKFEEKKRPVLKGIEKGRQNSGRLPSDDEDDEFTPPVRIR
jgi:RNA recognition motif-containing protein